MILYILIPYRISVYILLISWIFYTSSFYYDLHSVRNCCRWKFVESRCLWGLWRAGRTQICVMSCWNWKSGFLHVCFKNSFLIIMLRLSVLYHFKSIWNPVSGLLNLAASLPKDTATPSLGPGLYISFGCPDDLMQPDFLTKLSYDSHDVVSSLPSVVWSLHYIILKNFFAWLNYDSSHCFGRCIFHVIDAV